MRLHHIALWSKDIERLSAFYRKYFGACAGETYVNREKGFSSIFLRFDEGCSIELMHMIRKGQLLLEGGIKLSFADQFYVLSGQIRPV